MTLSIAYTIEQTDAGWIVWRTLPGQEPQVAAAYPSAHPRPHASRHLADRAAATRLGVTVGHP